jgi:glycosyltransferase involved in cell wall biosynthesis
MKILLVTHFFPPKHNAGTENYTLGLALAFQARGHSVQVLCAEDWHSGNAYWNGVTQDVYDGIRVTRIHLNWMLADQPNRILYDSEPVNNWITHFLQRESFDVIHITSMASLGVGVMRVIKSAGIPLLLTLMDFWFICPSIQLLRSDGEICDGITTARQCQSCLMDNAGISRKLSKIGFSSDSRALLWEKLSQLKVVSRQRGFRGHLLDMNERKRLLKDALELPDVVLSHSKVVRDTFAVHTNREILILRNGHDLSWFKPLDRKKTDYRLQIGYVGQIIPVKGVHVLIEAYKRLGLNGNSKLSIWGDPYKNVEYTRRLETLIADEPAISLRGSFRHDDLTGVFSDIDVLVVPSIWLENAPLVIQEAFVTQTPVIASNIGGMAEAVTHEVNGLLFECGNVDELARLFQRLVAEPELLDTLRAGIPKVKRIEDEVDELEDIYSQLYSK